MAWGHRLKRLTKREQKLCRSAGWGCGAATCKASIEYMSNYSYVSVHGHAAHARRSFCAHHARLYAMRCCLAWPARGRRVRVRVAGLERAA